MDQWIIGHGKTKSELTRKLHLCGLALIVLESAMSTARGRHPQSYPAMKLVNCSNDLAWHTVPQGLNSDTNDMGTSNCFLVGFKTHYAGENIYLVL